MTTLHLLFHPAGRAACWAATLPGDCVVLLAAAAAVAQEFPLPAADVRCCAIIDAAAQLPAAQISSTPLSSTPLSSTPLTAASIEAIGYDELVTLAASAERVVSWD